MGAWNDMRAALEAAHAAQRVADDAANAMADILATRLRHVRPYRLAQLKRELRGFDAKRQVWSS